MNTRITTARVAGIVLALGFGPVSEGQERHEAHDVGLVRFPVSCSAAAQETFKRGVALLHSFWYDEAARKFAETTRVDPRCAMGYWGVAMSLYHPLWAPPTPVDLAKGRAAVEEAKSVGAKTQRERDYVATAEAFYRDSGQRSHGERAAAWRNAMERLSNPYPEDREAAIFFALSLLATAPATDKTYANQRRAAGILNRILPEQPEHPGIAHYMIHSYDSPELALVALPAARSFAKIAPAVPHALHMPSHLHGAGVVAGFDPIEPRVCGGGAEPSGECAGGPDVAGRIARDGLPGVRVPANVPGFGGQGRGEAGSGVTSLDQNVFQAAYALAAIPARYTLERRRWSAAAALEIGPAATAWVNFPYAEAVTYFARALEQRGAVMRRARGSKSRSWQRSGARCPRYRGSTTGARRWKFSDCRRRRGRTRRRTRRFGFKSDAGSGRARVAERSRVP